jgi:hypothetical protein
MYLKQARNKKTGRTYLSIVHGYWDAEAKQSRTRTIIKIGYLDEVAKQYKDPIAHYTEMAKVMDEERKKNTTISLSFDMAQQLERDGSNRKNYGHVVFSKIYHELEIDRFMKNARRHERFKFNTDAIMRLLVFSRILFPASKRATVLDKGLFFDSFGFSLDDVYDALTHFDNVSGALQKHLHETLTARYGRDTSLVYYDVTNYWFEIDEQDDLRKNGPSKEHKKDPIVQMGLLLDKAGLPISYRLFPGNTHDSQTLMPMLAEVKKNYGVKRIVAVADKGLNSGDNIAYNTILGDGYIYSKSVRGASSEFKAWMLEERGYRMASDNFRIKSRIVPDAGIHVTIAQNGKQKTKRTVKIEQKQIVFWSEKYAARARRKREETIAKAYELIKNPAKYRRALDYGAASYISNIKIDSKTGEIVNYKDKLMLDMEKIKNEAKYDGYYSIVSSELDDADEHIIDMYRGLWRIEESFKVTKSVLEARPIFLRTPEHINAHFLICFIALLIGRITEMRLGGKYTLAKIADTLRKVSCSHIAQNLWLFDFADSVTDEMNVAFGTDFGRKVMTLGEIKKNLGTAKKA